MLLYVEGGTSMDGHKGVQGIACCIKHARLHPFIRVPCLHRHAVQLLPDAVGPVSLCTMLTYCLSRVPLVLFALVFCNKTPGCLQMNLLNCKGHQVDVSIRTGCLHAMLTVRVPADSTAAAARMPLEGVVEALFHGDSDWAAHDVLVSC